MNVNFEAIEKTWFKPKNKILFTKEELELLEDVFGLAIDECPSEDIKKINELEQKIKTYSGAWIKPKNSVLDVTEKILKDDIEYFRETEQYCLANLLECILENIQELKKENENG